MVTSSHSRENQLQPQALIPHTSHTHILPVMIITQFLLLILTFEEKEKKNKEFSAPQNLTVL